MRRQLFLCAVVLFGGLSTVNLSTIPAEAHALGRSHLPHCKNAMEGRGGLAVGKDKAKQRAVRKWTYDVKRAHGFRFTSWTFASNRDFHCKKKAGTWRCRAHALPCDAQAR